MSDKKKNIEVKKNNPVKPVATKKCSNKLQVWICAAVIALVTYVVFSPSLQNEFTNWDDEVYVLNDHLVVSNAVDIGRIFETPVSSNYHPLTILSLAMNYQDGKLDPAEYHLENVLLHVLNTLLVFCFIFLLTRRNLLMAAIVALLFGIHPMHVESVSWVSERKDVLYVLFFMAGLITYLRYKETKKIAWYLVTLLLFVCSCLSKGMAVVFPIVLLLIDYMRGEKWSTKIIVGKIPFFLLALVFGIVAFKVQQGKAIASMQTFTVFQRLMFVSYGAIMYIAKFFVPVKLSAFYPYPDLLNPNGIGAIYHLSPFILLAIIGALIYFIKKKEKEIVFGLLFYFAGVALVLQFITVGLAIMADRYSYLSYIGLAFIVAYIVNKLWQSSKGAWASLKYPVILLVIVGISLFSAQTYSRTQVWKNSGTLWADVVDEYPYSSVGYEHLGDYYDSKKDYKQALAAYNRAVLFDLNNRNAVYNRGLMFMEHFNKTDSAIADFTKAIELDPSYPNAYNDRGSLYFEKGKTDSALADISKAIELNPTSAEYYYNRGLCYKAGSDFAKALPDIAKAIQLSAQPPAVYYYNEGLCHAMLNNYAAAITDFSKAIELSPSSAEYWKVRSYVENKAGQTDRANVDAMKAQQLQGGKKN